MGGGLDSGSELHHWVPFSLESLVVLAPTEVCSLNPAVHGMVANVPKCHGIPCPTQRKEWQLP